jgi:hypothetical protein
MSTAAATVISAVSKLDPTGIASKKVVDIVTLFHGKYEQMKENKEVCEGLNKQIGITDDSPPIFSDIFANWKADKLIEK